MKTYENIDLSDITVDQQTLACTLAFAWVPGTNKHQRDTSKMLVVGVDRPGERVLVDMARQGGSERAWLPVEDGDSDDGRVAAVRLVRPVEDDA